MKNQQIKLKEPLAISPITHEFTKKIYAAIKKMCLLYKLENSQKLIEVYMSMATEDIQKKEFSPIQFFTAFEKVLRDKRGFCPNYADIYQEATKSKKLKDRERHEDIWNALLHYSRRALDIEDNLVYTIGVSRGVFEELRHCHDFNRHKLKERVFDLLYLHDNGELQLDEAPNKTIKTAHSGKFYSKNTPISSLKDINMSTPLNHKVDNTLKLTKNQSSFFNFFDSFKESKIADKLKKEG